MEEKVQNRASEEHQGGPKPQGDPSPPTGSNKRSSRTQGPRGHRQ